MRLVLTILLLVSVAVGMYLGGNGFEGVNDVWLNRVIAGLIAVSAVALFFVACHHWRKFFTMKMGVRERVAVLSLAVLTTVLWVPVEGYNSFNAAQYVARDQRALDTRRQGVLEVSAWEEQLRDLQAEVARMEGTQAGYVGAERDEVRRLEAEVASVAAEIEDLDNDGIRANDRLLPGLRAKLGRMEESLMLAQDRLDSRAKLYVDEIGLAKLAVVAHQRQRGSVLAQAEEKQVAAQFVMNTEALAMAGVFGGATEAERLSRGGLAASWMIVLIITVIQYILAFALESMGGWKGPGWGRRAAGAEEAEKQKVQPKLHQELRMDVSKVDAERTGEDVIPDAVKEKAVKMLTDVVESVGVVERRRAMWGAQSMGLLPRDVITPAMISNATVMDLMKWTKEYITPYFQRQLRPQAAQA